MRLVSVGDSFPKGVIKTKSNIRNSESEQVRICFPQRIIEKSSYFNDGLLNLAKRGIGQEEMFYRLYLHIYDLTPNDFVLINMSGMMRSGTYLPGTNTYVTKGTSRVFEPVFQSRLLGCGVHQILKSRNIPHMFIPSFTPHHLYFEKGDIDEINIIGTEGTANSLFDIIAERFNSNVRHFKSRLNNHTEFDVEPSKYISECLHPTELGHILIAETIIPFIENYIDQI